ncbi:hypothetical protein [Limnohabitans radicicola]|uniref:Uncharacterized protein n=1 Tax=Limnohabitans radicicola TaxID=2771427 RepID=A0A927FKA5_9BURK|nr:hypothetical protein [Limnohabitans radicicola]MBD8051085.1 hypothetical protein [Limnohabitans radicicola]
MNAFPRPVFGSPPTTKALLAIILMATSAAPCAARGGPAPIPDAPSASSASSPGLAKVQPNPPSKPEVRSDAGSATVPAKAATAGQTADDDKDINPFTAQPLSEAQLRRTLEREKLITAIASEKTKQTQSSSELQVARLRNAAEKSRFSSEVKILSPISPSAPLPTPGSVPGSGPSPAKRTAAGAQAQPGFFAPTLAGHAQLTHTPETFAPAPQGARASRAEIRFADEIVELKPAASSAPSIVASVDAQRASTDSAQPRPISPIAVPAAALPPVPQTFPLVPAPQSTP